MKGILIISDGLGGRPTDHRGQTCLQAAKTPHLDGLAARGAVGLLDPVRPGVRPGSDVAHLSIFGYDPYDVYPGRGVFEALGAGLDVEKGDICFRTNFATVDESMTVLDRRAGRIESGQDQLERALDRLRLDEYPEVEIHFKASTEHRGALVLRGPNLSAAIGESDPHQEGKRVLEVGPMDGSAEAARTAELVNRFIVRSHELLDPLPLNRDRASRGERPANIVLPRGASGMPHFETLPQRYGIEGCVIAGGALYIGIGRAAGLRFVPVEGATGGLDSNLKNKAAAAAEQLAELDFVFLHMKGTDTAGHDHDAPAKIAFIERVDEAVGLLLQQIEWDSTHLAFTGDHCTPPVYGDHTSEPVPILFAGPNVMPDEVERFDESSAQRGGLGRFAGQVVPMIAGYNNWLAKFGS